MFSKIYIIYICIAVITCLLKNCFNLCIIHHICIMHYTHYLLCIICEKCVIVYAQIIACRKLYDWRNGWTYTEKYFQNLIKSNRNEIVFTIFRMIWNQTDVLCVPNQSENVHYNLITVWFNKISKKCLCVYANPSSQKTR